MLTNGRDITPKVSVPGSAEVVGVAADWIRDHPPAPDPQLYNEHFPVVASRLYRVGSGFVHGYKWALNYVQKRNGDVDAHRMGAEAIGIAVGFAECAVALYEAQAQWHGAPTDCSTTQNAWKDHFGVFGPLLLRRDRPPRRRCRQSPGHCGPLVRLPLVSVVQPFRHGPVFPVSLP